MSQRISIPGALPLTPFPGSPYLGPGISIVDYATAAGGLTWNGYTPGAAAVTTIAAQPSLVQPWVIHGWSLEYQLYRLHLSGQPNFGKLGRVYAGLVQGSAVQTIQAREPNAGSAVPWISGVTAPPPDQSMITLLFDGSTDNSPPAAVATPPNALNVTLSVIDWRVASFQLPTPIQLQSADQLGFGIWITPSITQNAGLLVMTANYNIQTEL